jgi:hypothetical protein
MSDILSREQLEARAAWEEKPMGETANITEHTVLSYERRAIKTALWLAEKGRLAALWKQYPTNCGAVCSERERCPTDQPFLCESAAQELLEWWRDDE